MKVFRKSRSTIEKNIKLTGIIFAVIIASTTAIIAWKLIDFNYFSSLLHTDIGEFIFRIILLILAIFFLYILVGIILYLILFYLGSLFIYFFSKDPALREEVKSIIWDRDYNDY